MNDKFKLAIIFILLIGIGGFLFLTTPSVDIDDFSVEKHVETTKYESGKIEKNYYIDYSFNVKESNAIDYLSGDVNIYDNQGNLLDSDSFNTYCESSWYGYSINVDKSTYKKIDSVELILFDSDKSSELCRTSTSNVVKGENNKDYVDDVLDYTLEPRTTSTPPYSASSSNNHDSSSYDTNNDVYGDYVGNSNTHKFHTSYCSWADNIKSGNMVSFSSRQDAIDSGYSPCGHCNP